MITFVRDEGDHVFGQAELVALAAGEPVPRLYLAPLETHVLEGVFVWNIRNKYKSVTLLHTGVTGSK